jgi:N-acyl-L-homoserine lactone synthetase
LLDFGDANTAAASPNVFSASRYCASETLTQRQKTHDQELVLARTKLLLLSARSSSHWCTPITPS